MNERTGRQRWGVFIMVLALTVLACQGASGLNPFATATPTPTATLPPTPTFTITPSPTHTPTPRPSGVLIEKQSDGRTLVTDQDNRYQFLLPVKWAVIFSSQKDLQQAAQSASEADPDFVQMAENFKDVDPDIFRLAAINIDKDNLNAEFPTLLTMNAYEDPMASTMPMAFVTAMIEDTVFEGAPSTTWDVIDNVNKVEVGIVKGPMTLDAPDGSQATVAGMVIAFEANEKIIMIQIAVPEKFAEQILTPFDDIIDSIKMDIQ